MASTLENFLTKPAAVKPQAGTVHWFNECIERGKREPFAEVITLTPGLAGHLIRNNPDNRAFRPVKVKHFARDMKAGRWPLNGETIIVAKTGELNDGQHRLQAIIDANVCVQATIHFGVERATRTTVDQGSARGAGAYLRMDGLPYAEVAAGVARHILAFEDTDGAHLGTGKQFTASEVADRARRDAGIMDAINATAAFAHDAQPFGLTHSMLAFAYYIFSREDEAEAIELLEQIAKGENIRAGHPAYVLRSKLLNNKYNRDDKIELLFRTWNFYRNGHRSLKASSMGTLGNLPSVA